MHTLKVTFGGAEPSDALAWHIRNKVAKLQALWPEMIACDVRIEQLEPRHSRRTINRVRIEIQDRHGNVFVTRNGPRPREHEDVYATLRDAFAGAAQTLRRRSPVRSDAEERGLDRPTVPTPLRSLQARSRRGQVAS